MTTPSRHSLTIGLMITSIVLLLTLEWFWLRGAYLDAAENFRNQTNLLFRNTIFSMHDSLVQRSFRPIDVDLRPKMKGKARVLITDSLRFESQALRDSLHLFPPPEPFTRIEIIATSDESDSLIRLASPFVSRLQHDGSDRRFIFRMDATTLSVDSIRYYFAKALTNAGIEADFRIHTIHGKRTLMLEAPKDGGRWNPYTSVVSLNPRDHYIAMFGTLNTVFIREITPQILFAIFITVVTSGSFYIMYRHLRGQQRLMQIKNDFISNISHELKTPVATVSVALEALKNFRALEDAQRTSEYLDIAQDELKRLTLMTDRILKTAAFDEHGLDLKMGPVNFDEVVGQVLSSTRVVFERKGTDLRYSKTGTNFQLHGSESHLTNVLFNLIDNALKYSGDGALVEVRLTDAGEKLLLSVRDTGIGIPKEFHDKLFQKFFRVPAGDLHNTKGYGLGLNYVHHVVTAHNGSISIESEPGRGSEFTIELPRKHEDTDTVR